MMSSWLPVRMGRVPLSRVLADEILVEQVTFPPLMNGIQTPHGGKQIVSVGGGLTRGWKGGCCIVRYGDMALLKT